MSTEKETQKKKKWPIFVGVLGAIAVAAGAAFVYWFLFRTPSFDSPLEAITSCLTQLGDQLDAETLGSSSLEKKLDTASIHDKIEKNGKNLNLSVTLEDSDFSQLSMLHGVTLGYSSQNDVKNECSNTSLNASFLGIGADLGIYMDKKAIALVSDEFLSETYLTANKTELLEAIKEHLPEQENNYVESLLEQQFLSASNGLNDYVEYAAKQLPKSLISFAKEWDVKESKNHPTLTIGENTYDCYTYEISISTKAFQDFLKDYGTYLSKYDYESNSCFRILGEIAPLDGSKQMSQKIKDFLYALPEQLDSNSKEALDLTMYLSRKGQLLGADVQIQETHLQLRFGGKKPGQDIFMTLEGKIAETAFEYTFTSTHSSNEEIESALLQLQLSINNEEIVNLQKEQNYNPEDDSFDLEIHFNANILGNPSSADLFIQGEYKDIEKGESYKIDISKLSLNLDAKNAPFSTITLSAQISYGVLAESVEKPKGTKYDILNLTEQDVEKIGKTMKKSLIFSYLLQAVPDDTINEYLKNAFAIITDW